MARTDPRWGDAFAQLAMRLRAPLGPDAVAIEHVVSTAVPGLLAKPILDIAIGLAATADLDGVWSDHWRRAGLSITEITEKTVDACSCSTPVHCTEWPMSASLTIGTSARSDTWRFETGCGEMRRPGPSMRK